MVTYNTIHVQVQVHIKAPWGCTFSCYQCHDQPDPLLPFYHRGWSHTIHTCTRTGYRQARPKEGEPPPPRWAKATLYNNPQSPFAPREVRDMKAGTGKKMLFKLTAQTLRNMFDRPRSGGTLGINSQAFALYGARYSRNSTAKNPRGPFYHKAFKGSRSRGENNSLPRPQSYYWSCRQSQKETQNMFSFCGWIKGNVRTIIMTVKLLLVMVARVRWRHRICFRSAVGLKEKCAQLL